MANERKQIRDAVKSIITNADLGFAEISIGRRNRIPAANLPACCIYTDAEEIAVSTMVRPRLLNRTVALQIQIFIKETTTPGDDAIDTLAYAIEDALTTDKNLSLSFVKNIVPAAWSIQAEEEEADNKYLAGTLAIICEYEKTEAT